MKRSGAELVVRALEDEGVELAFGIPGTHNIELYDALAGSETVRPLLVTDEQSASFMADGAWRASGRLACVNVVPGAGLTHALSGIAEAFMDNVPMLVLGCGIRTDTGSAYQLHDVDQLAIAAPVTKAAWRIETGAEIYPAVRRACRLAREGCPGPVMVEIPANLYLFRHEVDAASLGASALPPPSTPAVAGVDELDRVVALLARAERPLLYLGLGAAGAGQDLVALAERLGAPVATTIQGKGVFPESHPLFLWPGFGAAAPPFVRRIVAECDLTLAIGCRFGEVATGSYGLEPPGPLLHVDIDPEVPGRNFPTELGITADAPIFVAELLRRLGEAESVRSRGKPADPHTSTRTSTRTSTAEQIREGHERVRQEWLAEAGDGVSPPRLLRSLQARFGPDAIYATDSGNGTFLAMECLRLDGPGRFLAPVDYSCMGYAVPAALGAKLARPDAPVVALAGDGAFLMTGLELLTAAAQRIPVAVLVLRDRELAQISQFQAVALGRKTASELPDYDLEPLCRGMGVECLRLGEDSAVDDVLESAAAILAEGRPVVVDVAIDYSRKTYFTRGVVRTNLLRLPWPDRLRFLGRAVARKLTRA